MIKIIYLFLKDLIENYSVYMKKWDMKKRFMMEQFIGQGFINPEFF